MFILVDYILITMVNPTVATPATPAAAPASTKTGRPRLRAMDALRMVAALAVVLFHFTTRDNGRWGDVLPFEIFPDFSTVARYGYAALHLFFTISGFVILMSVWGRTPRQFVASRVSRLYPAFWVAVLLTSSLRWLAPSFESLTPGQALANLTMFHEPFDVPSADGVYWTLWVEMQFYLLLLVVSFFGFTRRRVLTIAAVVPLIGSTLILIDPDYGKHLTMLSWAALFGAGMVLYVIYRDGHTCGRWALVGLNAAQAALIAWTRKVDSIDAVASGEPTSPLIFTIVVLAAMTAVALTALVPAIRDLDWQMLTAFGALTYPLYLIHEYFGWATIDALHPYLNKWLTLGIAIAISFAIAWLIHRLVEEPLHRPLRHFLAGRPRVDLRRTAT